MVATLLWKINKKVMGLLSVIAKKLRKNKKAMSIWMTRHQKKVEKKLNKKKEAEEDLEKTERKNKGR